MAVMTLCHSICISVNYNSSHNRSCIAKQTLVHIYSSNTKLLFSEYFI